MLLKCIFNNLLHLVALFIAKMCLEFEHNQSEYHITDAMFDSSSLGIEVDMHLHMFRFLGLARGIHIPRGQLCSMIRTFGKPHVHMVYVYPIKYLKCIVIKYIDTYKVRV